LRVPGFIYIIVKHLTLRNLILGFIMVILSYLIKHYLFPLFDFKPEFTFNIGDTIYKFLIPTEILAGLTSLLASLSIKGLLEEVLNNGYLIPDTGTGPNYHRVNNYNLYMDNGSGSSSGSGNNQGSGWASGSGSGSGQVNNPQAGSDSGSDWRSRFRASDNDNPDIVRSKRIEDLDLENKKVLSHFSVEELAIILDTVEEQKSHYGSSSVPAAASEFAKWTAKEEAVIKAIEERLTEDSDSSSDRKGKGKESLVKDNSAESKGKEVLPEDRYNYPTEAEEDPKDKGKGKEKRSYGDDSSDENSSSKRTKN